MIVIMIIIDFIDWIYSVSRDTFDIEEASSIFFCFPLISSQQQSTCLFFIAPNHSPKPQSGGYILEIGSF